MRATADREPASRAWAFFSPLDTGFFGTRWVRGGTLGLDFWVEGYTEFSVYAISDDQWALDYILFDERAQTAMFGPVQFLTGPGVLNGQIGYYHQLIIAPAMCVAQRMRLRGRAILGVPFTDNSWVRVFARPGARA